MQDEDMDLAADFPYQGAHGVIVGNTEAMWPRFVAALRADPARVEAAHPLETWIEEQVRGAFPQAREIVFAHAGPPWIPIQRLAEEAGLAWLSPAHLSIHPVFGPWISLRALVVLPGEAPPAPARKVSPCPACAGACVPAFERAVAAGEATGAAWREWLAAREACPIGREHRFSEAHLAYGYTKDKEILRRLLLVSP